MGIKKNQWIKFLSVWILYVSLHFTYKIAPCALTQLFGCPVETIFHHMKMAFLSYTIISIIEFIVIKPKDINTYLSSRMLSAILFSYFSFVIWFIVPVLFGPIEVAWGEILYSNIILALSLAATIYIETFIARIKFDRKITWVITAIYIIIMVVFVVSAFHTPQMDVFEPHAH